MTSIHKDLFYLESNVRRLNESDTLQQNNLQQNSHVRIIMKLKGGGDHVTGSKKKKTPPQDNSIGVLEEAVKNMRIDRAQKN